MSDQEFFACIKSGNLSTVSDLLTDNKDLAQQRDEKGATGLHHATWLGFSDIAKVLIESRADVNAIDEEFGATPAGWAIEYLRELGGLLAIEIEDLVFAINNNDETWVQRFLERFPHLKDANDENGKPVKQHAAECSSELIKSLFA